MAAHHHEETGYLHNLTPEQEHALKQAREKYQAWLREEKLVCLFGVVVTSDAVDRAGGL